MDVGVLSNIFFVAIGMIKFLMVIGIEYFYMFPLLFLPLPSISCMHVLRGRALSVTSTSSPPVLSTQ